MDYKTFPVYVVVVVVDDVVVVVVVVVVVIVVVVAVVVVVVVVVIVVVVIVVVSGPANPPQQPVPPSSFRYRLTIQLQGSVEGVKHYTIYVYKYNFATESWDELRDITNLKAWDFPYDITDLTPGLYGVVVNAHLKSGDIATVISAVQNAGAPGE